MGKQHAWKQHVDMEQVRRLVKATRKQSGAFTTNNDGLPKDKDIARAIATGKALYTHNSVLILEQLADPIQVMDYRGETMYTTPACVMVTDLAGPDSRELLGRIMLHLMTMPAEKRPNLYVRTWLLDHEQRKLVEAAGLTQLAASVTEGGALIGTYGPKHLATLDHEEEDLIATKLMHQEHITESQAKAMIKARIEKAEKPPKAIKDAMSTIPGKHTSALGFEVQPGETTSKAGRIGTRKTIANGQTVLFLVPLQVGSDSKTWLHSFTTQGQETRELLQDRALYYIDPRRPWTITNLGNQEVRFLIITTKVAEANQELVDFINQ